MLQAIRELLKSKTSWVAIIGAAVVGIMQHFGLPLEIIQIIAGLFGLKIGQQALADLGKNSK